MEDKALPLSLMYNTFQYTIFQTIRICFVPHLFQARKDPLALSIVHDLEGAHSQTCRLSSTKSPAQTSQRSDPRRCFRSAESERMTKATKTTKPIENTSQASDYGSENVDAVAALMAPCALEASHSVPLSASSSQSASKNRLMTFGLSLCVAGAVLVAYRSASAKIAVSDVSVPAMNFASDQSSTTVSTTGPVLESNRAFLLKALTKNELCVDHGGGAKTTVTMQPCSPTSPNQLFVYDTTSKQIKSSIKPTLCIEIGDPGNDMTLKTCDTTAKNANQKIIYDPSLQVFRNNPKKNDGLCFDDRGLDVVGTGFTTWSCTSTTPNQKFGFKYVDEWLAEQPTIDAVGNNGPFQLAALGRDAMCLDADATQVSIQVCEKGKASQFFQRPKWVDDRKLLRLRMDTSMCVDTAAMKLAKCNATLLSQQIVFDRVTAQLRLGTSCLDGGAKADNSVVLTACNSSNANQRFQYVMEPLLPKFFYPWCFGPIRFLIPTQPVSCIWRRSAYEGRRRIQIFVVGGCDRSWMENGFQCDDDTNHLATQERSTNCVEFGPSGVPTAATCVTNIPSQVIVYNNTTHQIKNPFNNLCMSLGVKDPFKPDWNITLAPCNSADKNQIFYATGK